MRLQKEKIRLEGYMISHKSFIKALIQKRRFEISCISAPKQMIAVIFERYFFDTYTWRNKKQEEHFANKMHDDVFIMKVELLHIINSDALINLQSRHCTKVVKENNQMHIEGLDEIDNKILTVIEKNARLSYSEIGEQVGTSRVSVKNHMDMLEDKGIIQGYVTVVNPIGLKEGRLFFIDD